LALTGSALMVIGLLGLTRLTPETGYLTGLLVPAILLGLGGGLGFVPLTPLVMSTVRPEEAGAAGGALQTMQQLGATLGLATLVTVFGLALRSSANPVAPASVVSAMTITFAVAAGIAALNILVALTFRKAPAVPPAPRVSTVEYSRAR
jgi:MFS family permease